MKDFKITPTNTLSLLRGDFELTSKRERVLQHVKTALYMFKKEWFLDTSRGIDYSQGLKNTEFSEYEIRKQILNVSGVKSILNYRQNFNRTDCCIEIFATILTVYGEADFSEIIQKEGDFEH